MDLDKIQKEFSFLEGTYHNIHPLDKKHIAVSFFKEMMNNERYELDDVTKLIKRFPHLKKIAKDEIFMIAKTLDDLNEWLY